LFHGFSSAIVNNLVAAAEGEEYGLKIPEKLC